MEKQLIKEARESYEKAENIAVDYYEKLHLKLLDREFIKLLTSNIDFWKNNHIKEEKLFYSIFKNSIKKPPKDYKNYIKWINKKGELENYLDRSISYIFMRDLGKSLDDVEVKKGINKTVEELKDYLKEPKLNKDNESFTMVEIYKKAKEEGVEERLIWLIKKLRLVAKNLPEGMDKNQAIRKVIKIIAGVIMHKLQSLEGEIDSKKRADEIDKGIILGYGYGLTYPFIDDLLDSKILSVNDEKNYSELIKETLITGIVPDLEECCWDNIKLISYIHLELKEGFENIKNYQSKESLNRFLSLAYVFFNSQEIDRNKDLNNKSYNNKDIYVPIILKAAASRLMVPIVINSSEDSSFENKMFFYGIYNQLADDFTDIFEDLEKGSVTGYTYYMKHHRERKDLINPFELYWVVISNLIDEVYNSDKKTAEVILSRAINSLKRFKKRLGLKKYNEFMEIFKIKDVQFNKLINDMADKAEEIDFFDKLLRDYIIETLKKQREEREKFLKSIDEITADLNQWLIIKESGETLLEGKIIEASNYSIKGNGKRLRPIIAYMMATESFNLNKNHIIPLMKSLEYMHTASLILDDLPSQDNADTRRGHETLHLKYDVAIAELTSIYLTEKAIEEQSFLEKDFNSKNVLKLITYTTKMVQATCGGQLMDLESRGKKLKVEDLEDLSFYKTGRAFEASVIMPAILAEAKESEIRELKKFSKYAGIAFQIKDDILDFEGDSDLLGKAVKKDIENNNSTFVSILGIKGAEKKLWEYYALALDTLKEIDRNTDFLKELMNYIISREH